jgi:CRISPR-associated endonuclease/helicase Cas3
VQAAGRCNREGLLASPGRVIVFQPAGGGLPRGAYSRGTSITQNLLHDSGFDFHNPSVYETYFRLLFQAADLDAHNIQQLRRSFDFPEVSSELRFIEDNTVPVVVNYVPTGEQYSPVPKLLDQIRNRDRYPRHILRALQPFIVNVYAHALEQLESTGLVNEVAMGFREWCGLYDRVRGLMIANQNPADLLA